MFRNFLFTQIGDKIRKARENKELGRDYLATVLNMDVRTFEKIENNQRDIHLKEATQLAKALEITPEALLFGEPRLVFEHCNENAAVYNAGTVNYQQFSEVKALYESVIARLEKIIEDKDTLIEALRTQIRKDT